MPLFGTVRQCLDEARVLRVSLKDRATRLISESQQASEINVIG